MPGFFSRICGATDAILGGRSGASKRLKKQAEESGALLPVFVAPGQLNPFISNELMNGPFSPISYISGGKVATGFDAQAHPRFGDTYSIDFTMEQ